MADAHHPNTFAVQQQVLYRTRTDTHWQEGTIIGVTVDDRKTRPSEDGPIRENTHAEGCDEHLYLIASAEYYSLFEEDRNPIVECMCDVRIVDADATGRWHEQQLTDPESLALLMLDSTRRGEKVTATWVEIGRSDSDAIYFQVNVGDAAKTNITLAWAYVHDLILWGGGVPINREEPTE